MKKTKYFILTILCFFSFLNKPKAITNIELSEGIISPTFQSDIKKYNIFLDENTEEITINTTKEGVDIEVLNEGVHHLEKGENEVFITVIKNDNTETIYTLNITRGEVIYDKENAFLKELTIEGYFINFKPETLNYEINIDSIINELNIEYKPQNPNSKVELTGSYNLNKSENIIEIKVTSESKDKTNIYRIKANKILPTFKEEEEKTNILGKTTLTKKEKIIIASTISIISLLIILIFYLILFKRKRKKLNKKSYTSLHTLHM